MQQRKLLFFSGKGGIIMEIMDLLPYAMAVFTGIGSWIGSYFMSTKKSKQDLKSLSESNKHEIEKLMKQHEVDINSLKEKHELKMDKVNVEHKHRLEIMEKENQNHILQKQQEQKASEQSMLMQGVAGELGSMLSGAFNTPEMQSRLQQELMKSMVKK
jgi:flagellar biosynthesis component FlhA